MTLGMAFDVGVTQVEVSVPDWATLEYAVRERLTQGEGFALATINLDHLVKLRHDAAFRGAYARHDMVTADGNPIVWLAGLAGHHLELVPGSDAIEPLCKIAADLDVPVAFIGSTPETLAAAKTDLEARIPGLRVAFTEAPPMGFDPDSDAAYALLQRLERSDARLTFLALGAPKQERLAAIGRMLVPEIGFACIGAGLDFFAGTQRRAPRWMRLLALEWLWRLGGNPCRLAMRYAACAAILPQEVYKALRLRHRHRA